MLGDFPFLSSSRLADPIHGLKADGLRSDLVHFLVISWSMKGRHSLILFILFCPYHAALRDLSSQTRDGVPVPCNGSLTIGLLG